MSSRSPRRAGPFTLAHVNPGDIRVRHLYTPDVIRLHSVRHKAYWSDGQRREQDSMAALARLVRRGGQVLEAGGHIGYTSVYFAHLVGPRGAVHVFEPDADNLAYVRANVAARPVVTVVPRALGSGVADDVTTIDLYARETGLAPDFIRIDVEGCEWEVLSGAAETLDRLRPTMMVEVRANHDEVAELLRGLGYRLHEPGGDRLDGIPDGLTNVFCIPEGHEFAGA